MDVHLKPYLFDWRCCLSILLYKTGAVLKMQKSIFSKRRWLFQEPTVVITDDSHNTPLEIYGCTYRLNLPGCSWRLAYTNPDCSSSYHWDWVDFNVEYSPKGAQDFVKAGECLCERCVIKVWYKSCHYGNCVQQTTEPLMQKKTNNKRTRTPTLSVSHIYIYLYNQIYAIII